MPPPFVPAPPPDVVVRPWMDESVRGLPAWGELLRGASVGGEPARGAPARGERAGDDLAPAAPRGRADGFVPAFENGGRGSSVGFGSSLGFGVRVVSDGASARPALAEAVAEAPAAVEHPAPLAPLAAYLDDPAVTDVFVNGSRGLWVDRGAGAVRDPLWRADEDAVRELALRLIGLGGRHIDEASPCVDVRLTSGMRIHAVLPPISTGGTTVSIRIPRVVAR